MPKTLKEGEEIKTIGLGTRAKAPKGRGQQVFAIQEIKETR